MNMELYMDEIKNNHTEDNTDPQKKKSKTILNTLDNLGEGLLSMEGHNSKQIWEQAYVKPIYDDYETDGKTTHIVVDQSKNLQQNLQQLGKFSFVIPKSNK